MSILSIQSWVTYGHVGNAAALFPLQRLGAEVWAINTVQFSNHPGYGAHTGQALDAAIVTSLVDGLQARAVLGAVDAVLSGYLGGAATGAAVLDAVTRVRARRPDALWCCDPVMGDRGSGLYVPPGIAGFFAGPAIAQADILTPNHFELEQLTGRPCADLASACAAASALRHRLRPHGPGLVLVTSLEVDETPGDAIDLLLASADGHWLLRTPRLVFPDGVNGAGDLIAALFLLHVLRARDPVRAVEQAASAVWGILRQTALAGAREPLIVAAQDELAAPGRRFTAQLLRNQGAG